MELENYSKEERIDNSSTSNGQYVDHEKVALSKYMTSAYKMMCYALLLTGASAWVVAHSETLRNIFLGSFWIWALVELGLVIAISAGIQKFEARTLNILFVIYSIVNGLTLSSIFLYPLTTPFSIFFTLPTVFSSIFSQIFSAFAPILSLI